MNAINKLAKLSEICVISDIRIKRIEERCARGEITSGEAIDLIVKEEKRVGEAMKRVTFNEVEEYGLMGTNYN